jgi:hypothetical protein
MKLRTASAGIILVLVAVWLGFVVHRAPRFAGSGLGVAFGIAAAVLMALPLLYIPVRRFAGLRRRIAARLPLATVLHLHVATGLIGALLAIVHTGHRFEHPVGIALTALVLIVAVSGYAARRARHAR